MHPLRSAITHRHSLSIALMLALQAGHLFAQATYPTPVLTSLSPLGGKPGSTVDFSFKGADIDGAKSILLSSAQAGVSYEIPIVQLPEKKGALSAKLPADVKSDLYDIRLVGRYGVSNPRVFQVSPLAVVDSPGTNTKGDTALKVPLDSAIHGVFKAGAPHWFSFEAKKGQRVLAAFAGTRFDSRASMVGAVYDTSGRELARLRGGLLDLRVPADGSFKLRVNDLMFGAGDDYGYRLSLTTGAVVWAASKDTLYGWNLPGGQVVPGLRVNQGQPVERLKADAATAAKLVADSPWKTLVITTENEAPETVPPATTPVQIGQAFGGWFPGSGTPRSFDLAYKSGERFVVEVISQQAGYPTDPAMLVELVKKDAAGVETLTSQAELTDPAAVVPAPSVKVTQLDPLYAYEAKADGVIRISISDPLNAANGRRHPYMLRVRPMAASSMDQAIAMHPLLPRAAAAAPYELTSGNVWRQGITAIEVQLPGRTAQSDPLELTLSNPPAGVTVLGGFVGKGQMLGYIGLRASADAAAGAKVLGGITRTAFLSWAVKDAAREAMITRIAGAPAVGVVADQAPALVEQVTPGVPEVAADGKLDIPLKVTRHSAFKDDLKLKVLGLMDVAKAPEATIAAKANDGKLTLDVKALKLAPGDYGFILQAPAKMSFRRNAEDVTAAETAAKKSADAQVAAKKEVDAANAALKAIKPEDKTAQAAQQIKVKDAAAKLAVADKAKVAADKAAKDTATKNPAKDAIFIVYSNPIRIRVKEVAKK